MIRLITRSRLKMLYDEIEAQEAENEQNCEKNIEMVRQMEGLEAARDTLEKELESVQTKLHEAEARIQEYEQSLDRHDSNEVTLLIDDDLMRITPRVRWKAGIEEKMFELGYLDDTNINNRMAAQVALLTIGSEGMEQLLETFTPEPTEV